MIQQTVQFNRIVRQTYSMFFVQGTATIEDPRHDKTQQAWAS